MLEQIINDIFDYLINKFICFNSLINLSCTCKYFYYNIYITDLLNVKNKYLDKLTDVILMQPKYVYVRFLNANDNCKITTVNHMTKLENLAAEYRCGINDDGIRNINLKVLNASYNSKITMVNHMTRLEKLWAGYSCGINDEGIRNINLKMLCATNNSKITTVNHMTKLEELWAGFKECGINDEGIMGINLKILNAICNSKITVTKR